MILQIKMTSLVNQSETFTRAVSAPEHANRERRCCRSEKLHRGRFLCSRRPPAARARADRYAGYEPDDPAQGAGCTGTRRRDLAACRQGHLCRGPRRQFRSRKCRKPAPAADPGAHDAGAPLHRTRHRPRSGDQRVPGAHHSDQSWPRTAREEASSWAEYEVQDDLFHRAIAEASDNILLLSLFDQLNQVRRAVAWEQRDPRHDAAAARTFQLCRTRTDRRGDRGPRTRRGAGGHAPAHRVRRRPACSERPDTERTASEQRRNAGRQTTRTQRTSFSGRRTHEKPAKKNHRHRGRDPAGRWA